MKFYFLQLPSYTAAVSEVPESRVILNSKNDLQAKISTSGLPHLRNQKEENVMETISRG